MCNIIKRISIIVVLVFLSINILAQPKIDNLKNKLKLSTDINNKIEICFQIDSLYIAISIDSTIKYANYGLSLIDEKHGMNRKNDYLYLLGDCYLNLDKYKLSLNYLQQALEGYKKGRNTKKIIITTNEIGRLYYRSSNFENALSYYQQSLLIAHQLNDTLNSCKILGNIGNIYKNIKDYKLALSNYEKALNLAPKFDSNVIANTLNNMSITYGEMQDFKMALKYGTAALNLYEKLNIKAEIAKVCSNIGETYKRLNNIDMALKYTIEAYMIIVDSDNKLYKIYILCNIGEIYILKKNYIKAKEYLDKAKNIATDIGNKECLSHVYESLFNYYSETKDYQKALENHKLFKVVNDSIYSKESSDKIAELQIKFDIEAKENENVILRQKTEIQQLAINKQTYLRNTFIYISIIFSLIVIFVVYRNHIKQQANRILIEKNELINKQKDELEEVYKTKDKLFSVITHDLKNPFSTLVSLCNFLESNFNSIDDNYKFSAIQSLNRSIINVNELMINLTDWLNLKDNNLVLHKTNFNLNLTIESVIQLYKTMAEQMSIDLQTQITPNIYALGDERMIRTVIRNLVDNALKFTPVKGKIEIIVSDDNNKLKVAVKDTGVGIDEKDKKNLFCLAKSFSNESTLYEKGGLGLILAKEFIEKNDGNIWVESEVGKGSTFYFTLIKGV